MLSAFTCLARSCLVDVLSCVLCCDGCKEKSTNYFCTCHPTTLCSPETSSCSFWQMECGCYGSNVGNGCFADYRTCCSSCRFLSEKERQRFISNASYHGYDHALRRFIAANSKFHLETLETFALATSETQGILHSAMMGWGWKDACARPKQCIELFLELGGDINSRDHAGDTALHVAIYRRHQSAVAFLIEKGADVNKVGVELEFRMRTPNWVNPKVAGTPLHYAIHYSLPEDSPDSQVILRLLLLAGADPESHCPSARDMASFCHRTDCISTMDDTRENARSRFYRALLDYGLAEVLCELAGSYLWSPI